ncbi:MAG: hypothetical protein BWY82_02044 [Verrucomicrobia bacterium ADurb.Bin474]|nr:MAG: hypothetical protein BWY82_02044 [Verrucomicrobia bacterium ADurb.Bin474]
MNPKLQFDLGSPHVAGLFDHSKKGRKAQSDPNVIRRVVLIVDGANDRSSLGDLHADVFVGVHGANETYRVLVRVSPAEFPLCAAKIVISLGVLQRSFVEINVLGSVNKTQNGTLSQKIDDLCDGIAGKRIRVLGRSPAFVFSGSENSAIKRLVHGYSSTGSATAWIERFD